MQLLNKGSIKLLVFVPASILLLSSCSSTSIQERFYSVDIYRYQLAESSANLVNKNLKGKKLSNEKNSLDILVASEKDYEDFIDTTGMEPFLSNYKYSFKKCQINNTTLKEYKENTVESGTSCSYSYKDNFTQLAFTANDYHQGKTAYTLDFRSDQANAFNYSVNLNSKKEYLILRYKEESSTLMFIIQRNLVDRPWSYYKKAPQYDKQAR